MNDQVFKLLWLSGHILFTLGATYYIFVLIPAYIGGRKHYITNCALTNEDIQKILDEKGLKQIPIFKFQITTRGKETDVVLRGIKSLIKLTEEDIFKDRIRVDVVTEVDEDKIIIEEELKVWNIPLNFYVVPPDYKTAKKTLRKARALHYMIEKRNEESGERGYIFYLDAESVIEDIDFRRIVFNIIKEGKKVTEGPIVYPLGWFNTNIISRQMEANRPWNCYHCHKVMTNPPPQHLHGSNLVVEENLALELGWDFGNIDGQAFIAEDIIFGLQAYLKYGGDIFGWHGGEILEQPPISIKDSIRQRVRWVTGVWQALEMLKRSKDFNKLKNREKYSLRTRIGYRTILYSLGFIAWLFFFLFSYVWARAIINYFFFPSDEYSEETSSIIFNIWSFILIPGLIMWLVSTQIGLSRILERMDISKGSKIIEHLKILFITPVAAGVETYGAFIATLRWFLGFRKVEWIPTKK